MTTSTRQYTQVARAAKQDRTRSALLDAAEEAFFAGPWERASLESMARGAGVTKQTLLRHFGSKEALFEAAYARAFEQARNQRLSAPTDDIDGAVDNLLDHYEEEGRRSMRIGAMEAGPLGDIGGRARRMHYEWVEHAFGAWLDALPPAERARTRAALIVLCDVQSWWILSHDLELPRGEVHATLVTTIRRLLVKEDS